jgi:hypothetical protein
MTFEQWAQSVKGSPILGNQSGSNEEKIRRAEQKKRAIEACEIYIRRLGRNRRKEK